LYGTQVHGISLNSFFTNLRDSGPSIMIIEDTKKHVFGCFATEPWRVEPHFYGDGECFLFTLSPQTKAYHWKGHKRYFMCSRRDFVAMGGGEQFGLWIDSDIDWGSSYPNETFASPCLASSEDFQINIVEVWGFEG